MTATTGKLQFDADTWTGSGQGVLGASDTLATAVNTLCGALQDAGACWGEDNIGQAFINGQGGKQGFGASRDQVLNSLAQMVNLLRETGAAMVLTGGAFAAAEQANTIGASAPKQPSAPKVSQYQLPPSAATVIKTDPLPGEFMQIIGILEDIVAGCQYPLGSMSALGSMQQALSDASKAITGVKEEVEHYCQAVEEISTGKAATQFASFVAKLCGNSGGLAWLAEACQGLSGSVNTLIEQKNAARQQFLLALVFLLASFIVADALAGITFGGSIGAWFAEAEAEGLVLRMMLQAVLRGVVEGIWYAGGMDLIHQYSQMSNGLQSTFNWVEFGKSVGEGAVAGGVAGGLSLGLAKTGIVDGLVKLAGEGSVATFAGKVVLSGVAGTAGMVASQAAFDGGQVNVTQAAQFGFGFGLIGTALDGGARPNADGPRLMTDPTDSAALGPDLPGRVPSGTDGIPSGSNRSGGQDSPGVSGTSDLAADPGGTDTGLAGEQPTPGNGDIRSLLGGQDQATPKGDASGSVSVLTGTSDVHGDVGGSADVVPGGSHGDIAGSGDVVPGSRADLAGSGDVVPGGSRDVVPGGSHGDVAGSGDVVPGSRADLAGSGDVVPGGSRDVVPGGSHGDVAGSGDAVPGSRADLAGSGDVVPGGSHGDIAGSGDVAPRGSADVRPGGTADVTSGGTADVVPGGSHGDIAGSGDVVPGSRADLAGSGDVAPGGSGDVVPGGSHGDIAGSGDVAPRGSADVRPGGTADVTPGGSHGDLTGSGDAVPLGSDGVVPRGSGDVGQSGTPADVGGGPGSTVEVPVVSHADLGGAGDQSAAGGHPGGHSADGTDGANSGTPHDGTGGAANARRPGRLNGDGSVPPGNGRPGIRHSDLEGLAPEHADFIRFASRTYGNRFIVHDFSPVVRAHIADFSRVPPEVHERVASFLDARGGNAGIYIGDTSVTGLDDLGILSGIQPRGWPAGKTWDTVAGAYEPNSGVVAFGKGEHAESSLPLHEFGHMADEVYGPPGVRNASAMGGSFASVYDDVVRLESRPGAINGYFRQPGEAGQSELFAEGFMGYHLPDATAQLTKIAGSEAGGRALKQYFDNLLGGNGSPDPGLSGTQTISYPMYPQQPRWGNPPHPDAGPPDASPGGMHGDGGLSAASDPSRLARPDALPSGADSNPGLASDPGRGTLPNGAPRGRHAAQVGSTDSNTRGSASDPAGEATGPDAAAGNGQVGRVKGWMHGVINRSTDNGAIPSRSDDRLMRDPTDSARGIPSGSNDAGNGLAGRLKGFMHSSTDGSASGDRLMRDPTDSARGIPSGSNDAGNGLAGRLKGFMHSSTDGSASGDRLMRDPTDSARGVPGTFDAGNGGDGRLKGFMHGVLNGSTPDNGEIPSSSDPTWKPLDPWEQRYAVIGASTVPPISSPPGSPSGAGVPGGGLPPVMPTMPGGGVPGGSVPAGSVPAVPGGSVPAVPGGSVPGVPSGNVPGVPGGSVPGVPGGSVPGVPGGSVPGVPGGSVPGVPGGSVPSTTLPNIPATPSPGGTVPGGSVPVSVPTIPGGASGLGGVSGAPGLPNLPVGGGLASGAGGPSGDGAVGFGAGNGVSPGGTTATSGATDGSRTGGFGFPLGGLGGFGGQGASRGEGRAREAWESQDRETWDPEGVEMPALGADGVIGENGAWSESGAPAAAFGHDDGFAPQVPFNGVGRDGRSGDGWRDQSDQQRQQWMEELRRHWTEEKPDVWRPEGRNAAKVLRQRWRDDD